MILLLTHRPDLTNAHQLTFGKPNVEVPTLKTKIDRNKGIPDILYM